MKEIRHCSILLHPVKHSMFTRTIFIRPDSELIRESVCTCAKLFVDEGNVHMAQVKSWKNKNIDGFYMKTTQKGGFSKLSVKIKKRSIPTYSIFQHVSIIQYIFSAESYFDSRIASQFFIYSFFQEKMLGDISFKLETKIMNFMSVILS